MLERRGSDLDRGTLELLQRLDEIVSFGITAIVVFQLAYAVVPPG